MAFLHSADVAINHHVNLRAVYLYAMPLIGNQFMMKSLTKLIGRTKIIPVANRFDVAPHIVTLVKSLVFIIRVFLKVLFLKLMNSTSLTTVN